MQGLLAAVLKGWVGDLEEGEGGVYSSALLLIWKMEALC